MTFGLPLGTTGHYLVLEYNEKRDTFYLFGHPELPWVPSDSELERMVRLK